MSEYTEQADRICEELGLKVEFDLVGTTVKPDWDKHNHDIYYVWLIRGDKRELFEFTDSTMNTAARLKKPLTQHERNLDCYEFRKLCIKEYKKLSAYDFLACVTKSDPGMFTDFCSDLGYDSDSIKALSIYNAACDEYKKMRKLFTPDELEKLQEIA